MKLRRHHNNKALRKIKGDKIYKEVVRIARKLKIPTKLVDRNQGQSSSIVK